MAPISLSVLVAALDSSFRRLQMRSYAGKTFVFMVIMVCELAVDLPAGFAGRPQR